MYHVSSPHGTAVHPQEGWHCPTHLPFLLQTLKNVVDIQQRYPNIEVATKTRQAARRILNKAVDGLRELHEGGLLDDKQYGILYGVSCKWYTRANTSPGAHTSARNNQTWVGKTLGTA